ncbi:hypothetical protein I2I11_04795 [Pontibacter sp. 172403-2]|uniref:S8 family serine peptidase n=1 Tax=Pontibacter rufus TaxID=2791028 RepID=UPI0018AFE88C|nr:hypothetical protein [Pontibacter sp. 172403-2]MBF9252600.1 hypothetical protein [Pontibacter sp. 172403-2]
MNKLLPFLSGMLMLITFSACRDNSASPVRNVRFDPDLLNKMQVAGNACSSYSYVDGGQSKSLGVVYTKQVLVAFEPHISAADQQLLLQKYGFVKSLGTQAASKSAVLQSLVLQDGLNCKQVEQALLTLAADAQIAYAAPYFLSGKQLLGISNEVIVTVEQDGLSTLQELARDYKAEVQPSSPGSNIYLVKVSKHSNGNALELANFLQKQPGIAQAAPDFILAAQ